MRKQDMCIIRKKDIRWNRHFENVETLAEKNKENWTDYEKQIWEETKADNTVKVHFLGISEAVFDMLEWKGEKCSWNTFKSGSM